MGPFEKFDNIENRLQDNALPLNLGTNGNGSKKRNKRVEIPKAEGEHGPKKIKNPDQKVYMSDWWKKKHGITDPDYSMPKSQFIREGHRKHDTKQSIKELGANIGLYGGLFGAMVGLSKRQ